MEVNKEQAEKCRDLGAQALRQGDCDKAVKYFSKSLRLFPLPGVEALLVQAELQGRQPPPQPQPPGRATTSSGTAATDASSRHTSGGSSSSSFPNHHHPRTASRQESTASAASEVTGADGRTYTPDQVEVVRLVLRAKEGGRGAHYRVLQIPTEANEGQIKKAYRKLALKLHPDKNSAPHADEAFKAVGLAYATLSDPQKRHIYDRYGEEDPDNRGGAGPRGGGMHMNGHDVNPEDIFNMFFGGGMPGMHHNGGNGFHMYTTGFGPGVQFRAARPRGRPRDAAHRGAGGGGGDPDAMDPNAIWSLFLQLVPVLLIVAMSFLHVNEADSRHAMPGEGKYFSLTAKDPFVNRLTTRLTEVKDIPFYVSRQFLQTYNRDRYQLGQVEAMVERAYEDYLVKECKAQIAYKRRLSDMASAHPGGPDSEERNQKLEKAQAFELSRCAELEDLFPRRRKASHHGGHPLN